jgi:hypothetical protein
MRELARDLGVSYPTARQRFADMLARLGLEAVAVGSDGYPAEAAPSREDVLRRLAAGELDLDEASAQLNLTRAELSDPPAMLAGDTGGREDTP